MLKIYQGADLTGLALAVIERAAIDAAAGDPTAGAWLLSDEAAAYGELAKFEPETLGKIAIRSLERLANDK